MSSYTEKTITPKDLSDQSIIKTTITIERSNEVLLTGTIYDSCCDPIEGAVVQIIEIDEYYQSNLGYVITNQNGEFAVAVVKHENVNYQLDVYEPLIAIDKDEYDDADTK